MSDKSAQTKKMLAKNADKIAIGVLAVLLLGLGYTYWQEQSNPIGTETVTEKPAALQDQLAEDPSLTMLQNMSPNPQLANSPEIQRVAQLNMFDFSTIDAEKSVESQAEAQLQQAQALIEQGKTDEARNILAEVKKVLSYKPEVQQALDKITTKTETAPTAEQPAPM